MPFLKTIIWARNYSHQLVLTEITLHFDFNASIFTSKSTQPAIFLSLRESSADAFYKDEEHSRKPPIHIERLSVSLILAS